MTSLRSSAKVRELAQLIQSGEGLGSSHSLTSVFDEREQQLIDDGLRKNLDAVQNGRRADQKSPPQIPPRPNRSTGRRADTGIAPTVEEKTETVEEEDDNENVLSSEEGSGLRRAVTPGASNVQELEQQSRQAQEKTKELADQHKSCECDVQALHKEIVKLKEEVIDLTAAGNKGRELREDLKCQIEDLQEKLSRAKLLEQKLRDKLEESRRIETDLRTQLTEAKFQVTQQRCDHEARELDLQQQIRQVGNDRNMAMALGHFGYQTPRIEVSHRCSQSDVAFTQQQQHENHLLKLEHARLQQEITELARSHAAARSEVNDTRQRNAHLQKMKEHKEQVRGVYRTRSDRTKLRILTFATT